MNLLRKALIPLGGVAVASLLLTIVAPRAAHALVATLVQVVNTASAPAITQNVPTLASQIVTLGCSIPGSQPTCGQINAQGIEATLPYIVPVSEELVITSFDFVPTVELSSGVVPATLANWNNGFIQGYFELFQINDASKETQIQFTPGIVFGSGHLPPARSGIWWSHW